MHMHMCMQMHMSPTHADRVCDLAPQTRLMHILLEPIAAFALVQMVSPPAKPASPCQLAPSFPLVLPKLICMLACGRPATEPSFQGDGATCGISA